MVVAAAVAIFGRRLSTAPYAFFFCVQLLLNTQAQTACLDFLKFLQ